MRSLLQFISEVDAATPGNTMGMGNPVADDGDGVCSEPLTAKAKKETLKKRKKKRSEEE